MTEEENETLPATVRPLIAKEVVTAFSIIATIVTVVWFFSSMAFRVEAAEVRIGKIEVVLDGLNQMQSDVAVIKSKMEGINEKIDGLTDILNDSEIRSQ